VGALALYAVPPASVGARPTRVAVVADHGLIAEAVRTALLGSGYDVVMVRWPRLDAGELGEGLPRRRRRRPAGPTPDVALLMSDLDRVELVRGAQTLIEGLNVPWLVLTGAPPGPVWGALYERGVNLVESTQLRLDATRELLEDLAHDRLERSGGRNRELIRQWLAFSRRRQDVAARMRTLTEREQEVLQRLHAGMTVREIAEEADVTQSTVRSQVKASLRKLDVSSQIAAVAVYEKWLTDAT
jgi:RNA polymerase sigma factor (sigma-70 family)